MAILKFFLNMVKDIYFLKVETSTSVSLKMVKLTGWDCISQMVKVRFGRVYGKMAN